MSKTTHNAVLAAIELIETGQTSAAKHNLDVLEVSLRANLKAKELEADPDQLVPPPANTHATIIVDDASGALADALRELVTTLDVPQEDCSCHIAPPCAYCSEHGHMRELLKAAKGALAIYDLAPGFGDYVAVDRAALKQVLAALVPNAPAHYIRELQFTQGVLFPDNPITLLCNQLQKN